MSGLLKHPEYKCRNCARWRQGKCITIEIPTGPDFFCAHFDKVDGPFIVDITCAGLVVIHKDCGYLVKSYGTKNYPLFMQGDRVAAQKAADLLNLLWQRRETSKDV